MMTQEMKNTTVPHPPAATPMYMISFHASPDRIWNTEMNDQCSVSKLFRGKSSPEPIWPPNSCMPRME